MHLLLTSAAAALALAAGPLAAADDAASRTAPTAQSRQPAPPATERSGSWCDWAALWRRIAEATADGGERGARYVALASRLPEAQEPAPRAGNDAIRR